VAERVEIPLVVRVDGIVERSETTWTRAGAYALSIATVLPAPELPVELVSSYVGHPELETRSVHLVLGPDRGEARIESVTHSPGEVDVVFAPRDCAYDHAQRLLDLLRDLGHDPAIDMPDGALRAVDAVDAR
jgi:hypothetical protein